MSTEIVAALTGGFTLASGLGGVMLAERFAARRRAVEGQERLAASVQTAFADYLAAVDAVTAEIEAIPTVPSGWVNRLVEQLERVFIIRWLTFIITQGLMRLLYGNRANEVDDRYLAASARIRLLAPPALLACVAELDEIRSGQRSRGNDWERRWAEARSRALMTARSLTA